jgi:long-chain fatty acid transport protein
LPIPTIGGSLQFGQNKQWTIAGGIFAPYTAITSWPESVNGQPSPSRYSLLTLDGSALVGMGLFASYKPIEELRFGLGLDALAGTFASRVVFSASPADRLLAAPEDPSYDTLSQLTVGPIFAPSLAMGATIVPTKIIRFGLSGHLPYWVSSPAHVKTRLPTAPEFDNAMQVGDGAHVNFRLPAVLRVGAELRPADQLRIEATYSVEFWSLHDTIDITPTDLTLVGVTGFPSPFPVSKISIPRNFKDAHSFRLGGEYRIQLKGWSLDVRLGFNFDQSGVSKGYLSPLTVDLDKITIAGGVGINVSARWRFDAVYARVQGFDTFVDPNDAKVPRINPVHGNPTPVEAINGGKYSAAANVVGVGFNYKW